MIIYNITVNIDKSIEKEWLLWMKETHIPEVINTGMFVSAQINKVLVKEKMNGINYSIQYSCENKDALNKYQKTFAQKLQQEHTKKFEGKFIASRTLLEVINEF